MLNIRINLTVNLRKMGAVLAAGVITLAHVVTPAYALTAPVVVTTPEKVVSVSLTHLKVVTTMSQAKKDLVSNGAKYFDAEALAFLTVYTQGWNDVEWRCLRYIWTNESHFNPKANNKSSGAYGIAQFMPSTWGNYKVVKTSDPRLQIKYGLRYIEARYGSACHAKYFWIKHHWY